MSGVRGFVFVDLDDSLFQTLGKCPPEEGLQPVAFLRDGTAHSFMTRKQRALWHLLASQMHPIPTTARDWAAYRRVRLPFAHGGILNHGGLILDPAGAPDPVWRAHMHQALEASQAGLQALLEQARGFAADQGLAVRLSIVEDDGLSLYLLAKYQDRPEDLDRLQREWVEPWLATQDGAYRPHRNGNNLAVLPRALGKERAVRYLIQRLREAHGEILTLGLGDSHSDGAFMAECDYQLTPRDSQLFARTFGDALGALG